MGITSTRINTEFESEVRLISNVHHRNIIRLLGCSAKGPDKLLVYEYVANGSLDTFLYGDKRGTLTLKAKGLNYIHEQFHVCIIHRDIKCSNILFDDDFQPKIADFGLARLLPNDQTHLSTRFAGTLGYTAPEYAIHGQLSEKVDTYAYGIMVLEIISGRRCSDMTNEPVTESLLQYAWKLYENDMHTPVSVRPTMSEVVVWLVNEVSIEQKPPSKRSLVQLDHNVINNASTSTAPSLSGATLTSTESRGR